MEKKIEKKKGLDYIRNIPKEAWKKKEWPICADFIEKEWGDVQTKTYKEKPRYPYKEDIDD